MFNTNKKQCINILHVDMNHMIIKHSIPSIMVKTKYNILPYEYVHVFLPRQKLINDKNLQEK